jgi:DNA polymerase-3 subunit delta'
VTLLPPPAVHPRAQRRLDGLLARRQWAPAYLVVGSAGSGLRAVARHLAQAMLCGGAEAPCGECLACRKLVHGNHPDCTRVGSLEEPVKVEVVRDQVIARLALQPYEGERQVILLEGADRLHPAAGNVLLKTLEEPPGEAVLILLARQLTPVLPTIQSRCQSVRLPVPGPDQWQAQAELAGLSPAAARLQARVAAAQVGEAAAMEPDELRRQLQACDRLWAILAEGDGGALMAWVEGLLGGKREEVAARLATWMAAFALWLRERMLLAWGCEGGRLTGDGEPPLPGPLLPSRLVEAAAARLLEAHRQLAGNGQGRLVVGSLLLALQDELARCHASR